MKKIICLFFIMSIVNTLACKLGGKREPYVSPESKLHKLVSGQTVQEDDGAGKLSLWKVESDWYAISAERLRELGIKLIEAENDAKVPD